MVGAVVGGGAGEVAGEGMVGSGVGGEERLEVVEGGGEGDEEGDEEA